MRRLLVGAIGVLAIVPALWALDDKKDKPDKEASPKEQYQALLGDLRKANEEDFKAYKEAKSDEEKDKIIKRFQERPPKYAGKFLALAEKNAKDPTAYDALIWIVTTAATAPEADKAADLIIKDHADRIGTLGVRLARSPAAAAEKLLRVILNKSEDKDKAQATMNLANNLKAQAERAETEKKPNAEKLSQQAEKYFEEVIQKHKDAEKLVEQAKGELFILRNLSIGKTAPEIEGEDIEGKKFKLSDYRGKVVVIDFWGHW